MFIVTNWASFQPYGMNSHAWTDFLTERTTGRRLFWSKKKRAMSFFDLKEGFILTLDQEDSLSVDGKMIWILPIRAFQKIYLS